MTRFFPFDAPEARVLFAAARQERLERLPEGVDLELLLDAAESEGLSGLLDVATRELALPSAIRTRLRHRSFVAHARGLQMLHELRRVVEAFDAAGVPLLPYKGPLLGEALYGDAGARTYGDLDVVVSERDADRGEAILRELGYAASDRLTPAQLRAHRRFNCETAYAHGERRVVVDFHWRFANVQFPLPLTFEEAWARRGALTIDGFTFPTLGPSDLVLNAVNHSAKHRWHRLETLATVAALGRLPVDWNEVEREAERRRILRQLGLSFLLARRIVGAAVPDLPRAWAAAEPHYETVQGWMHAALLTRTRRHVDAGGRDLFVLLDRRSDALRSLAVSVFAPTFSDWRAAKVPGAAYWLLRPIRLAGKYLRRGR